MTARAVLDKAMTEKDFAQQIVDLATMIGWRVYRTYDSRRSPAGFPDLVLVIGPAVLFREVKAMSGSLTWKQKDWLAALKEAGQDVGVWRPCDWDEIEAQLGGGT